MRVSRAGSLAAVAAAGAVAAGSAFAAAHVAAPTIASFTPTSAKAGASITVLGSHLTGVMTVKIDGMKATFKVVSPKKITVKVPAKAKTGPLAVTTKGGTAKSATRLTIS
jgi:hypothetical protein